jgi:hypothetical protein
LEKLVVGVQGGNKLGLAHSSIVIGIGAVENAPKL